MTTATTLDIALDRLRCLRDEASLEEPIERDRITAPLRLLGRDEVFAMAFALGCVPRLTDTQANLIEQIVGWVNLPTVDR